MQANHCLEARYPLFWRPRKELARGGYNIWAVTVLKSAFDNADLVQFTRTPVRSSNGATTRRYRSKLRLSISLLETQFCSLGPQEDPLQVQGQATAGGMRGQHHPHRLGQWEKEARLRACSRHCRRHSLWKACSLSRLRGPLLPCPLYAKDCLYS